MDDELLPVIFTLMGVWIASALVSHGPEAIERAIIITAVVGPVIWVWDRILKKRNEGK